VENLAIFSEPQDSHVSLSLGQNVLTVSDGQWQNFIFKTFVNLEDSSR